MPRARVTGLESYEDLPADHPDRRRIQNRNAQRVYRRKRTVSQAKEHMAAGGGEISSNQVPVLNPSKTSQPDGMNVNSLQQSGTILSPHRPTTETSRVESHIIPSPIIPHIQDPTVLNGDLVQASLRNSPPITTGADGDDLFFHQWEEWQPGISNRSIGVNLGPSGLENPEYAASKRFLPENRSPMLSRQDGPSDVRPRLDILNSPHPVEETPVTRGKVQMSGFNENMKDDLPCAPKYVSSHPPQQWPPSTQDRSFSGTSSQGRPLKGGNRNPFNESMTRPLGIQENLHGGHLAGKAAGSLSEPSCLQLQESSGSSSRDGTIDSDASSLDTGPGFPWRHLIHTCCEIGNLSLVEELIESGLEINKRDSAGNTPLHVAAKSGHQNIVIYLLSNGCEIDAGNNHGWTAVHLATVNGHADCLRTLLKANASPWARLTVSE